MLLEYIQAALRRAKYEILPDDGSYYGEIIECAGVYANAKTLEECREELREVLEEWVLFRVHKEADPFGRSDRRRIQEVPEQSEQKWF